MIASYTVMEEGFEGLRYQWGWLGIGSVEKRKERRAC